MHTNLLSYLLPSQESHLSPRHGGSFCALDIDVESQADEALQPDDVAKFDAFASPFAFLRRPRAEVFGGILGNVHEREDGSYGSDDRTSEIRREALIAFS